MPETFTITIDKDRYKILNTMMNASDLAPFNGFHTIMRDLLLISKQTDFWNEISDKGHALGLCTDPECKKVQPQDLKDLAK